MGKKYYQPFHGQPSRTYDLWVGTIPAQSAGTTVWYRIQVNDGTTSAYLKYGNTAGSGYHNPLGQWVRSSDVPASDNYSYQVEQPIPVELTAFTATVNNGAVILNWTTQTETENFGFHVYRSLFEDRDYVKITQSIIPGAGSLPKSFIITVILTQLWSNPKPIIISWLPWIIMAMWTIMDLLQLLLPVFA